MRKSIVALVAAVTLSVGACTSSLSDVERYALARQTYNATVTSLLSGIESGALKVGTPEERRRLLGLIERGDILLDGWESAILDDRNFGGVEDVLAVIRALMEAAAHE
ncbi:MAG: hypothetical protein D6812_02845 [Deltaproteobacteria bacterium]|nr:MAG: hypothetical protein D6812_02845 [Deltaproteobacteria bacterium]